MAYVTLDIYERTPPQAETLTFPSGARERRRLIRGLRGGCGEVARGMFPRLTLNGVEQLSHQCNDTRGSAMVPWLSIGSA